MPSQLEVFYREGHKGDTVPPLRAYQISELIAERTTEQKAA